MAKKTAKRNLIASVLAMSISASMLVGTTFAWFTDTATSSNNIIQTGTLDVGMYWTDTFGGDWNNVEGENATPIYNNTNWEPQYTDVKYVKIANEGSLAFQYELNVMPTGEVGKLAEVIDVYLIKDVKAAVTKADVANATPDGTFQDLIDGVITLDGVLLSGEETQAAIVLKMQNVGNEYQNQSIGDSFELRVLATQYTYEEDSFDNKYDAGSIIPPKAIIDTFTAEQIQAINDAGFVDLDGKAVGAELETAYNFQTTDTYEEAQAAPYRYWHADYVVTFDNAVAANTIGLAGYYASWCDANTDGKWLAIPVTEAIAANTPVRLLETAGIPMNYEEICLLVEEFQCGVWNTSADNYGTTMTVELRMYETKAAEDTDSNTKNEETGNYVVINSTSYTFAAETPASAPKAEIKTVTAEELAAINATNIVLENDANVKVELETAYVFAATETYEEAQNNPYADWYADFYVTLDKDIKAGELGLAGQYDAWSENWVAFYNPDDVTAGVATPLLGSVTSNGLGVKYEELILLFGEDTFQCGAFDNSNALQGVKMTVELRLTNPDNTSEYITVSTTSYTFA